MFKKIIEEILLRTDIVPFHFHCSKCQNPVVVNPTTYRILFNENDTIVCDNCLRKAGIKSLTKKVRSK